MDIIFIGFFALICVLLVVSLGREIDEKKKAGTKVGNESDNINEGKEENKTTSETK